MSVVAAGVSVTLSHADGDIDGGVDFFAMYVSRMRVESSERLVSAAAIEPMG